MASKMDVDMTDCREFFQKLQKAGSEDFKRELQSFIDGVGNEFLRICEDEIKRLRVMDTRNLLASFHKGADENIWLIEDDGLTLEVGSCTNYAAYVNDGHWTTKQGVERRFVPGYWQGERFIYDPSAKGGMVLKQHWVEGKHYFDSAQRIMEKMFHQLLDTKLQHWIDEYF